MKCHYSMCHTELNSGNKKIPRGMEGWIEIPYSNLCCVYRAVGSFVGKTIGSSLLEQFQRVKKLEPEIKFRFATGFNFCLSIEISFRSDFGFCLEGKVETIFPKNESPISNEIRVHNWFYCNVFLHVPFPNMLFVSFVINRCEEPKNSLHLYLYCLTFSRT